MHDVRRGRPTERHVSWDSSVMSDLLNLYEQGVSYKTDVVKLVTAYLNYEASGRIHGPTECICVRSCSFSFSPVDTVYCPNYQPYKNSLSIALRISRW